MAGRAPVQLTGPGTGERECPGAQAGPYGTRKGAWSITIN